MAGVAEHHGVGTRGGDDQHTVAPVADAARSACAASDRVADEPSARGACGVLAGDVRAGIVESNGFSHVQLSPWTRLLGRSPRAATSGTQLVGYAVSSTSSVGVSAPRASSGTVFGVSRPMR